MAEAEIEPMHSVDAGVVVVVVKEVQVLRGRAEETREEEELTGVSGAMELLESDGCDVVLMADEIKVTELTEMDSSTDSGTELMRADASDMLVEGREAVVMTEVASPPAAGVASTERTAVGSGEVSLVDRSVDTVDTTFSLVAAGTISTGVMEVVAVVECGVTERLGVMESEEVTVGAVGVSVGGVALVSVVGELVVAKSVAVALASGTDGLSSVSSAFAVAAAVELTASVHISVLESSTVFEGGVVRSVGSGTEFEIVSTEGVAAALRAGAAGVD